MNATKNDKKLYYILSGEGERGTWSVVYTTERGLKLRLAKERCNGARWVYVFRYSYFDTFENSHVGFSKEMGGYRIIPRSVYCDGQSLLEKNR